MARELTPCAIAERSLIKTYRKTLWNPFVAAVKRYELIAPGDKIAVCISGGKDSIVLAKLMQELQRHTDHPFELVFLVMDPGYNPANRQLIEENARKLEIPITVFESNIFEVTTVVDRNPCYLCAKMRRGFLYSKAQELGCNKIALGHNMDDFIETMLMNMTFQGAFSAMAPVMTMDKFPITIIRPLCLVNENNVAEYAVERRYPPQIKNCPYENDSNRKSMKELLAHLESLNPEARYNLWGAMSNIQPSLLPPKIEKKQ